MTQKTILSLGEAMVELSPSGGSDAWRLSFAGDTFNTAWYLRHLLPEAWRVGYYTRVGLGDFSSQMLRFMAEAGVETASIQRDPAREVGLYAISLNNGERSFSYWRGQSAARALADDPAYLAEVFAGAGTIYLSGITVAILPETGRQTLRAALAKARQAGAFVVFDPNLRPILWGNDAKMCAVTEAIAGEADLVLPSFDDETRHFGDATPEATLARYLRCGAAQVVVKNGGGPVVFGGAGGAGCVDDLEKRQPVDTTAAGDSFNAGYLAARLQGASTPDAIRAAHALSLEVIGARGALVPVALT